MTAKKALPLPDSLLRPSATGQIDGERAAFPKLAFDADASALGFDQFFRQGQSETSALEAAGQAAFDLFKFAEESREILRFDPDAGIRDPHFESIVAPRREVKFHTASGSGKLNGV